MGELELEASVEIHKTAADAAAEVVGTMAVKLSSMLQDNGRLLDELTAAAELRRLMEEERDRLRAVVDAARAYMESIDSTTVTRQYRQERMAELRRALRALDESDVMGGSDGG